MERFQRDKTLQSKYPLGESNPCFRTENPTSWATRRRGHKGRTTPPSEPRASQESKCRQQGENCQADQLREDKGSGGN